MPDPIQLPVIFDPNTSVALPDLQRQLWTAYEATGNVAIATNLPGNTPEGLQMLVKCDQPGSEKLLSMVGHTIDVWAWRCKPVSKEVEGGEQVQLTHSVIITHDGTMYETVGQGVPPCLVYLSLIHGMEPWEKGKVRVKVVAKATGKGNPFIQLQEVAAKP